MELTKVPELQSGERPETGPMQFGEDWPGVFIRGDNALMGYAPAVASALELLPQEAWAARSILKGLLDVLKSCAMQNFR